MEPKKKILVVEDEFFVALSVQDMIEQSGHQVVGPFRSLLSAWNAAQKEKIDAALLDIRIEGGTAFPVANTLQARHIPFAFVTAHTDLVSLKVYREAPVVPKPFEAREIAETLGTLLGRA